MVASSSAFTGATWAGAGAKPHWGRTRRASLAPRCAPRRLHRKRTSTADAGLVQGGRRRLARKVLRCPPTSCVLIGVAGNALNDGRDLLV